MSAVLLFKAHNPCNTSSKEKFYYIKQDAYKISIMFFLNLKPYQNEMVAPSLAGHA